MAPWFPGFVMFHYGNLLVIIFTFPYGEVKYLYSLLLLIHSFHQCIYQIVATLSSLWLPCSKRFDDSESID